MTLKDYRLSHNLSQRQMAEKMGICTLTYLRWENGHCKPSKLALKVIHKHFPGLDATTKVIP